MSERLRIGLHLQGGGSFGAWQAGVLANILDEPSLYQVVYISGTSAGAVNGALMAQVLNRSHLYGDGAEHAKAVQLAFWQQIGKANPFAPPPGNIPMANIVDSTRRFWAVFNPYLATLQGHAMAAFSHHASSTLRNSLTDALKVTDQGYISDTGGNQPVKLYVNAAVEKANGRHENMVFGGIKPVHIDNLLASTALKGVFRPQEYLGQKLWDGAYTANPSFTPLDVHQSEIDAVIHIATNRPDLSSITPKYQSDLTADNLRSTQGLVLHQMFGEVAVRTQSNVGPTHHVVVFDQTELNRSAKQNTHPDFIAALYRRGLQDGAQQLSAQRDFIGVSHTATQEYLRYIAEGAGSSHGLQPSDMHGAWGLPVRPSYPRLQLVRSGG